MKKMQGQKSQDSLECDALVMGGGCIGLSVANELAKHGQKVIVIEKDAIGHEATWASGGMIRSFTEDVDNEEFLELCIESQHLYPDFVAEIEKDSGLNLEFRTEGGILPAFTADEEAALKIKCAIARRHGSQAKMMVRAEMLGIEPQLSAQAISGLFMPSDHQINNRKLALGLGQALLKRNGKILEHTTIRSILRDGDRTTGVMTNKGPVYAQNVINCMGAWTSSLIPEVTVKPIKGQMLRVETRDEVIHHIISWHPYYLIPRMGNTIIVGSTVEDVGYDKEVTEDAFESLKRSFAKLLPGVRDYKIVERWAGLRPKSEDTFPVIGKIREGLYIAGGHFRNGILLAPVTARLLALQIRTGMEDQRFSPKRFMK